MGLLRPEQIDSQADIWTEAVRVLKKYRLLIFLVPTITFLTSYMFVQLMTEKYEATASLVVKLGRENTEPPVTAAKGIVYTTGVRQEEINTYIEMLMSPSLIESTVSTLGVNAFSFELSRPESFWGWIKYGVKKTARFVKQQWKNFLIFVKLKKKMTDFEAIVKLLHNSLEVKRVLNSDVIQLSLRLPAFDLTRKVLDTHIQLFLDKHIDMNRKGSLVRFFDQQVTESYNTLKVLEEKLIQAKNSWNFNQIDIQRSLLLDRQNDISQKIESMEKDFQGHSIEWLREQAENIKIQLEKLNKGEEVVKSIERERDTMETNYLLYMKQREETRISEELRNNRLSNISLLTPPSVNIEPVFPQKFKIVVLSIPLGIVIGLLLAFVFEYFDETITRPEDIDAIDGAVCLGIFHLK